MLIMLLVMGCIQQLPQLSGRELKEILRIHNLGSLGR